MKKPGSYKPFVPNMAVMDTFMAPDSTASRPNNESLDDRPRSPPDSPSTVREANINHYEPERDHWRDK